MKEFVACLAYTLLVFLLKMQFNISLNISFFINLILFVLGGALGFLLFYLDYFLYPFFAEKTDELAMKTDEFYQKKDFVTGIKFLKLNEEQMKFHVLKTAINLVILLVVTYFVYISSGSLFGAGVGFGLLFNFIFQLVSDMKNPVKLNQWFEQIKRPVDAQYQKWFVYVAIGLTILISL